MDFWKKARPENEQIDFIWLEKPPVVRWRPLVVHDRILHF